MSAWIYLLTAGVLEIGFTSMLKLTDNFTKLLPTVAFIACAMGSFFMLTRAIEHIPLGTAYAVWTGIGAVGTIIIGIVIYNEPTNFLRLFFLSTLIGSIIGLKFVTN